MSFDLPHYLAERKEAVDGALDRFLPPADAFPPSIHEAMRYSVFAGGKRLRPILVIAAAEVAGGAMEPVLPTACAFELIHTYSLIHDDLPAMDDDDFRRGRPTSHKVFGDAVAILAGDALFTLGVRLLTESFLQGDSNPVLLPQLLSEVTDAAGTPGMIGG
ncbi:MAG: polyprenyl synthetase family protein, partial [Candidatus Rokubacteria bacterium]|nr:polyprenyl synthetase family protein [Candidatus Rokubacteria bacterium]